MLSPAILMGNKNNAYESQSNMHFMIRPVWIHNGSNTGKNTLAYALLSEQSD